MNHFKRTAQLCALGILCFSCGIFKGAKQKKQVQGSTIAVVNAGSKNTADSTKRAKPGKLKNYDEIITKKALSSKGLLIVHLVEDRYFFEIPFGVMDKDLLIVNRISKGAAGASGSMIGYAGDQINESVVRFAKGPNYKLFVKSVSYTEKAADSSENGMYRSVLNSNLQPIVAAFDVKALSKDSSAMVIDVTDYLNGDNELLFFNTKSKSALKLGGVQADKSYINKVRAFAKNIEISTTKTYTRGTASATFEMNSSIVLLPEKLMPSRTYDNRVGYFTTGYVDFDTNPQGIKQTDMITRWRLEPADADKERYLRGEMVDPRKPIVFYIDPATPKKWVPYLIQGVNDWNIAFEQAGFKNAIVAKEAPTFAQDSTWSIDDALHNVIVYKPSAIANASGPHVHDPRSGEILETHVNWYHNVMQVLRNWYFIQASANDPAARKMKFDDELMGQLIRFVSSHEVGHTLGLRHNFGSSSSVPVEKLRNKAWVEANGHTPSIMDYARFNYVAQPEDGISEKGIFPRINDYDKWAIEWGYRWWPQLPAEQESAKLNNWIISKTSVNKRLWFGSETSQDDPRCQSEDLGDNAMLAGAYGIKNLKRIIPRLIEWTRQSNEDYANLKMMYGEARNQFSRYIGHVQRNIGGVMITPKSVEQKGALYAVVPKTVQRDAVKWLNQQVFKTPTWLLDKDILAKTGDDPVRVIGSLQAPLLSVLFSANTLNKLINNQVQFPANAYSPVSFLKDMEDGIWTELTNYGTISIYRRNLQKTYLNSPLKLCGFGVQASNMPANMPPGNYTVVSFVMDGSDASSIAKVQLKELQRKIRIALPQIKDQLSRYHLQDCLDQINRALTIK